MASLFSTCHLRGVLRLQGLEVDLFGSVARRDPKLGVLVFPCFFVGALPAGLVCVLFFCWDLAPEWGVCGCVRVCAELQIYPAVRMLLAGGQRGRARLCPTKLLAWSQELIISVCLLSLFKVHLPPSPECCGWLHPCSTSTKEAESSQVTPFIVLDFYRDFGTGDLVYLILLTRSYEIRSTL